jgi:PKD repeat protein
VSISGPVTVNVTGENGCSSELETTIEENIELPSIDVGEDFSVDCTFENIELAASGDTGEGFTLNWSTDDGNIAEGEETDSPLVDSPGTYILEVVNNATGCITEESITISQFINTPISSFTENINGAQIIFTDNSAGEPDSWFWSFGDGNSSADQNPEHIYTESGMYEVCLTISNECGEDISCQNIQVSVTGALNFSAIIDHLTCFEEHNGSITVSVFGGQPGYTIVWTGPNGFSSSEFTITDLAAGEYNMEVSDDSGTILTESFIIEEPNAIIYSTQITQHVSCQGEADGIIEGSASGGLEPLSYAWSNGEETPSIQDLAAGVYTCTITDANGCTEEFTYEIVEPEALTLQNNEIIDATNGESNGSIDITISGGTEPYEYSWSSGETTEDVDGMAEGSYTCEVTDANGCIINLGPFEIMNSTGLSEIEGLTALKYFPNPASEQLFVELNFDRISDFKISLINKLGQRLSEETCHASTYKAEIQLDQLSEGIYFLLITKADQSIMEKIIVQR